MLTLTLLTILVEPLGFHVPDSALFGVGLLCVWLVASAFRRFLRRKPNLEKRRKLIFQLVAKPKRIEAALAELTASRKELDRIQERMGIVTKKIQGLLELDESPSTGLAHGLVGGILSLGESLLSWLLCAAAGLFGMPPSFWAFASPLCAAAWVMLLHMVILGVVADKDRPARTIARAKLGTCITGIAVVTGVWLLLFGVRYGLPQQPNRIAHTVDSFQGNQADVVIISLVRNNSEGPRYGLGFVQERERMNVLISRASRLLVLVGSFEFFRHQLSETSPNTPSELDHWAHLIQLLEEMFRSGEAVRIPFRIGTAGGYR